MMLRGIVAALVFTPLVLQIGGQSSSSLRARIEASGLLALGQVDVPMKLPPGQELGMVSWMARDPKSGATWVLQRGDRADPVLAFDKDGRMLHSFGKGLFKIPHAIRLDAQGDVWTVDAGSSRVIEFSADGQVLKQIDVGGAAATGFGGATDIAFGPQRRMFISDGYANARIVEYTAEGREVREWGTTGSGPGEFHLPHSIVVDETGTLYVADRENGRIEKFDLDGKLKGEIDNLGRSYALALGPSGTLWASMSPMSEQPGAAGWIVQLDRATGKMLGYMPVSETPALHAVADADGLPMTDIGSRVVIFRRQ